MVPASFHLALYPLSWTKAEPGEEYKETRNEWNHPPPPNLREPPQRISLHGRRSPFIFSFFLRRDSKTELELSREFSKFSASFDRNVAENVGFKGTGMRLELIKPRRDCDARLANYNWRDHWIFEYSSFLFDPRISKSFEKALLSPRNRRLK